ncbi:MAG: 16S rRNA (adenine(1518)-N(6)/adenine(1519)-N(6))-dimethyltransferase RsmA [Polyangiales bacterium]
MTTIEAPAWEDPRRVLARHGLLPKRRLSQSFLVSRHAVDAIATAAVTQPGEHVVELGPGLGTLTAALLRRGARVLAIERDPDMLRVLEQELGPFGVELRHGDAAHVDYAELASSLRTKPSVAGNLPYAATGAILRNLTQHRELIARAVVMVQREVRDRLCAEPGTSDYGVLTVFTSAAFEIDTVLRLEPGAFHPPPRVKSAVVRLLPRATPLAEETATFTTLVHAAFQRRRKMLRNALASAFGLERSERALAQAGIDPQRRGETLSVAELARLASTLERET